MDRKRIGIRNNYDSAWIAGKYYLDSIVDVLEENPLNEVIKIPKLSIPYRFVRKVFGDNSKFLNLINLNQTKKFDLDYIYPCERYRLEAKRNIYWIPDFQENYYPEFFSKEEIIKRLAEHVRIAYSNDILILSSRSSKLDFERLYPKYTCKIFILSFISSLWGNDLSLNESILNKYGIDKQYFICSNQFWVHKNHFVVLKAIKKLIDSNRDVLVLFTGKEEDYRNPNYTDNLKKFVKLNRIEKNVRFLGFIPRQDQINLMIKSEAIIQPSYFEGWNTTIEDAKYLSKRVIASNLAVHKEQLGTNGLYFECDDYDELADIMLEVINCKENQIVDYEYKEQVKSYKNTINSIFNY